MSAGVSKRGSTFRGPFLRLVSDDADDAASAFEEKKDPLNQTIKVQLSDTIRVRYSPADGGKEITNELQVGRPANEDNNDPDRQDLHDIRNVKVNIVVFRNPANNAPVATREEVETDIRRANERLAQSTIRLHVLGVNMGGDGDPGVERPEPLQDGITDITETNFVKTLTPDERAILKFKDADINSIDIFYVGRVQQKLMFEAISYGQKRNGTTNPDGTPDVNNQNFIMIVAGDKSRPKEPFVLPHEIMHILLNSGHRKDEADTSLFTAALHTAEKGDGVLTRKRIGPYSETQGAFPKPGNDDTTTIRASAEKLPQ